MTHQRITYQDLDIEIGPGEGRDYPAKVRSPGGEAAGVFRLPYGPAELESRLKDVQIALLRATGRRRTVLTPQEQAVRDFGRALFDALFAGELRGCYDRSLPIVTQKGQGLRIRLRVQPPELLALPWEFLYDQRAGEYLCLSRHTPLVRYVELPQPSQPLAVSLPLRVLALAAGPDDLPPLDLEQERKRLERAVETLRKRGLVELRWVEGCTWRDLRRAVVQEPWHVFHFIGHGGFSRERDEGFLVLCDEHGESFRLLASGVARLLGDQRTLRLVILNSCDGARSGGRDEFSSIASILVRRGIPAVIGMQDAITDTAGIEFTQNFYEALTQGLPIDCAVADARIAINVALGETLEWSVPVLFLRSEDGVLFENNGEVLNTKLISLTVAQIDEADAHYRRGVDFNNRKQYDGAIMELTLAIGIRKDNHEYYYQRSDGYHHKGEYDRAIEDLYYAIQLMPENAFYYKERGMNYAWKRDYERAIVDLDRAIHIDPSQSDYYCQRGICYHKKGDHDSAIADLDYAIQIEPSQSDYYCQRGICYHAKGNHDFAIADFGRAIQINPNHAYYYHQRGVIYANKRDYDLAISDLDRAIQLDPNKAVSYFARGIVHRNKSNEIMAKIDFEKAIELGSEEAREQLEKLMFFENQFIREAENRYMDGLYAGRDGHWNESIDSLSDAIKFNPNRPDYYFERGIVYLIKRKYDLAIADFDRAIQLEPNNADFYNQRGVAYQKKRDRAKAKRDFERAVELGDEVAKENLKRVSGLRGLLGF